MKYVKKGYSLNSYNDIRSFATSVGLTTQDVQGAWLRREIGMQLPSSGMFLQP